MCARARMGAREKRGDARGRATREDGCGAKRKQPPAPRCRPRAHTPSAHPERAHPQKPPPNPLSRSEPEADRSAPGASLRLLHRIPPAASDLASLPAPSPRAERHGSRRFGSSQLIPTRPRSSPCRRLRSGRGPTPTFLPSTDREKQRACQVRSPEFAGVFCRRVLANRESRQANAGTNG